MLCVGRVETKRNRPTRRGLVKRCSDSCGGAPGGRSTSAALDRDPKLARISLQNAPPPMDGQEDGTLELFAAGSLHDQGSREIDAKDAYCPRCGQGQGDSLAWYYQPLWIGILTVLALGPFSLILVWRTPALSRNGRLAWTAGIALFSLYVAARLWRLYTMLQQSLLGL